MLLSAVTTADSCAEEEVFDCATGIASMALGGSGFLVGNLADEDLEAAEEASKGSLGSRLIKAPILKVTGSRVRWSLRPPMASPLSQEP
jgi:hypothetical protein